MAVALLWWATAPAAAHAALVGTDPAYGATVDTTPRQVSVMFDEPVTVADTGITVVDGDGRRVDTGEPVYADNAHTVSVALFPDLPDGTYLLGWTVLSADGHTVGGSSVFGIGVSPDTTSGDPPRDPVSVAADTVVRILAGFAYLGMALVVGIPVVARLGHRDRVFAPAVAQLIRIGAVTTAVSSMLIVAAIPARLGAADGWTDPRVWWQAVTSTPGVAMLVRAVAAVVPAVFPARRVALSMAVPVIVGSTVFAGHAISGPERYAAIAATVAHLVAMSVWVGGLVLAVLVWRRAGPIAWPSRFGGIALGAVAVLAITGTYQAWRSVYPVPALWATDWGRLLLLKLVLVLVAVVAAAIAHRMVRSRANPTVVVRVELGAQLAVLAVTAALAGVTPARDAYDPPTTLVIDLGPVRADIAVDGAAAGKQELTVRLYDTDGHPIDASEVTARLVRADGDLGPIDIAFRRVEPVELAPHYFVSRPTHVPLAGRWSLRLTVITGRATGYTGTVEYRVW
ncbi:copper resistance CopC/CopD family protein [Nocardia paucivorans]|uniref:copper resistance CopC/CopD family protein n=1 Tax=Nocardia paucivorans TaxID=114259 RepID=UPI001C3F37FA|nr:copper resistance protein CopC [Nocardia paucivorans]